MGINELQTTARYAALNHQLDVKLVFAICAHESSWNPWAVRYEPGFYARYIEKMAGLSETEKTMRATSFGLMQVMGQVAREKGFDDKYLTALCDPLNSVTYGCKKLKDCLVLANGDVKAALLRYNGGGDPDYPDYIFAELEKLK